jgi:hypothetical protein
MFVYMCVYIGTYIHRYIHTYIHTYRGRHKLLDTDQTVRDEGLIASVTMYVNFVFFVKYQLNMYSYIKYNIYTNCIYVKISLYDEYN